MPQQATWSLGIAGEAVLVGHEPVAWIEWLHFDVTPDHGALRCDSKLRSHVRLDSARLALASLVSGGMLIFRFGWRDGPPEDLATVWYKKWGALLSLARRGLEVHPETLRPALRPLCTGDHAAAWLRFELFKVTEVKSDYFNVWASFRERAPKSEAVLACFSCFEALQSSFYVCCSGFSRRKFQDREAGRARVRDETAGGKALG